MVPHEDLVSSLNGRVEEFALWRRGLDDAEITKRTFL
jgi:hypothetical protein